MATASRDPRSLADAASPDALWPGPGPLIDGQLRLPVDGLDYLVKLLESYESTRDLGIAPPMGIQTARRVHRKPAEPA